VPDRDRLHALLKRIDGRSYPAYRDLKGRWRLGDTLVFVDHVQGDPFAAPSRVRVRVPVALPDTCFTNADERLAAEDWLLRAFARGLRGERRGSGKSGLLEVYRPGPEVVERSACRLADGWCEVRFAVGLPARGRRVLGREAWELLSEDVVAAAGSLVPDDGFHAQVASVARQRALRRALGAAGLVAFVEDGSVLPRASGVDSRPLPGAVPFRAPPSLSVTLETPRGTASGLGVPRGVTVITGGGFHGKSTLLVAMEQGHLDRVPGDGREGVVCLPSAVKVRAEDGRAVWNVDISPFLRELPGGRRTEDFSTADASGSTSQAAAIVEAVASGSEVLFVDEDTSATNLLVRDARMRALIPRDAEPITPFVERVRQLVSAWDVSTVMVVGGVGDYLAVADTVIAMTDWEASDVTERAHALAGAPPEAPGPLAPVTPRVPSPRGLDAGKIRARDRRAVRLDREELDLTGVAGVLDGAHARTLGRALAFIGEERLADGRRDLSRVLDALDAILDDEGVEALSAFREPPGDLVRPRRHEVSAAWSRLRSARASERDP
jgi:predicted ABC-class ATPase